MELFPLNETSMGVFFTIVALFHSPRGLVLPNRGAYFQISGVGRWDYCSKNDVDNVPRRKYWGYE
jgi:hypothetical protein